MTNSDALVDDFNTKFEVSNEKEENVLPCVDIQQTGSPATPLRKYAVGVTPISTSVGPKNIPNIVAPAFATVCGIVCEADNVQAVFHLLYDSSTHSMSFHATGSSSPLSSIITPVGTTTYSWEGVIHIGYFLFDTNTY
jgi:hypothetical protein